MFCFSILVFVLKITIFPKQTHHNIYIVIRPRANKVGDKI